MNKHPASHMDHGFTETQWAFIFAKYADKTAFFIDTFELPEDLGTVTNELYGPTAGDLPIAEQDVFYAKRGDRKWDSRLIELPKRPTKFVRVIAGPHEETCAFCRGTNEHVTLGFMVQFGMTQADATGPCPKCTGGVIKHACILYTAYGVPTIDGATSPKEPGDLFMQRFLLHEQIRNTPPGVTTDPKLTERYFTLDTEIAASEKFWREHALAAP